MEAGFTKAMVREEARRLGIPIWNAPAAPCLSSRIAYGLAVTPNRVDQVARGERYLRTLGVGGDLRVRHHGGEARIEVHDSEFDRLRTRLVYVYLDNGQVWRETVRSRFRYESGLNVVITEGALGSTNLHADGMKKFAKVERVN